MFWTVTPWAATEFGLQLLALSRHPGAVPVAGRLKSAASGRSSGSLSGRQAQVGTVVGTLASTLASPPRLPSIVSDMA